MYKRDYNTYTEEWTTQTLFKTDSLTTHPQIHSFVPTMTILQILHSHNNLLTRHNYSNGQQQR